MIPLYQIDAFTDAAFGGNPAAVCLLDSERPAEWMQAVATEMNLSETAFLLPMRDGSFGLRWFTPTVEVDLCGHATIASAHVLWETGRIQTCSAARFHTRSGLLTATAEDGWTTLDFPATPPEPAEPPPGLIDALGVNPEFLGRSRFDYLIEVTDPGTLGRLAPDMRLLRATAARGVIVTSRSDDPSYDFISRFFAPGSGIDEDPATGSAHCALAPYWGRKLGKVEMVGRQVSKRGGTIRVAVRGDRVLLGGQALTVLRGELLV